MTKYRIEIDRSLCSGFGTCADLAPDVFELAPDGIAALHTGDSSNRDVLEAVDACPMGAISVIEAREEAA
jgi:ferredoxin